MINPTITEKTKEADKLFNVHSNFLSDRLTMIIKTKKSIPDDRPVSNAFFIPEILDVTFPKYISLESLSAEKRITNPIKANIKVITNVNIFKFASY